MNSPARAAVDVHRPPPWRNVKVLAWGFQLALGGAVLALLLWLIDNVRTNSSELGIPTGFEFLDQPAGFTIPGSSFRATEPVSSALVVGTLNTLRVTIVGIVLATIIGVLVGIGRLSTNWLVRKLSLVYVEAIRNVPLLGILIFAYLALVLTVLPRVEDSWSPAGLVLINRRDVAVPWYEGSGWRLLALVAIALLAASLVVRWRRRVADRTGAPSRSGLWALIAVLVILVLGGVVAGLGITTPESDGRRVSGGITGGPEYVALLLALVVYTSSHIAEIVRGSIQAVPRGQVQAAEALALTGFQRMWLVVLPQAMRIALPSLGNQYLNLAKNSSLGYAISFFELTKVTSTSIGNRSPAVPSYMLLMAIYLVISLTISAIVNVANRRLSLATR